MTAQQTALVIGGLTEIVGLCLAGLDIWLDPARTSVARLWARLREMAARLWQWIERKILRRSVVHHITVEAALSLDVAQRLKVHKAVPVNAPQEEQLQLLGGLVVEIQQRLNDLDEKLDTFAESVSQNMEGLRAETRALIDASIRENETTYRGWRVVGLALALVGASIIWAASIW